MTLEEIAEHLSVKRKDNLKNRNIPRLLEAGLLKDRDGGYVTPPDVEQRLKGFLEESGCVEAEQRQRAKIEREREAWRKASGTPPDPAPSQEEMESRRRARSTNGPCVECR